MSTSAPTAVPQPQLVSAGDYSSVVSIISWFVISSTVLAVIARLATRWVISRKILLDDFFIIAATLFSVAHIIAVSEEAANGIGQHEDDLSAIQLSNMQQSSFAADIMYMITLFCAKNSVVILLTTLTPVKIHKTLSYAAGAFITVWTITSIFAVAFQCHPPKTWVFIGNQCFDRAAFWTYFEVVNILTDWMLILLPLGIIWRIQARRAPKFVIFGCFATRIIVIAATVTRVIYFNDAFHSADYTFAAWPAVLCSVVVQGFSIITACIPYLKPFLESLESGLIRSDDLRRMGMTDMYGNGTDKMNSSQGSRHMMSNNRRSEKPHELGSMRKESTTNAKGFVVDTTQAVAIGTAHGDSDHAHHHSWDADSQSSQSKIIKKTTTMSWAIETKESEQPPPSTLPTPRTYNFDKSQTGIAE
ncbi:MAG: hypothetical protein MMC33_006147 [Icmadophila ericetorum]|nr:hypothetical protein [Icmadophila ericetorum]